MRESIGGAWLIGLVITFMMLFVAYLTVMINYSTAFKTKNEMVHIIEKYEGLSSGDQESSLGIINNYLSNSGYNATGKCDCKGSESCYGAKDIHNKLGNRLSKVNKRDEYYYCVIYNNAKDSSDNFENDIGYYDIQLFLTFDFPVLGQIGKFRVKGQTIKIHHINTEGLQGFKK